MEPTDPAERERLLAEAEIEAGHGIQHDHVAAWLRELAAGLQRLHATCNLVACPRP